MTKIELVTLNFVTQMKNKEKSKSSMRKFLKKASLALLFAAITPIIGCGDSKKNVMQANVETLSREEIKSRSFSELFKTIDVTEIQGDVFTLVNKDYSVLTAGNPSHFNSMVASWGGWGILFNNPAAFSFLRSNRYTLELINKEQRYTMTFFYDEYKNDIMPFGQQSGRDSDEKMRNTKLTSVQTPSGNMAYKEAKLIIECKLISVTTVSPNDFLVEENKKFVVDAHAQTKAYHKIVFGEITNVWERK